ncbi:hypothetical protein [Thiocapsa sp.]|uniref:hypothetical protein n=1 Tax=Thiocapsa sp. TaxID=2024551 RepID=UPI0025F65ADD|nr:hypothetical protein [Thiocapsa sp.]
MRPDRFAALYPRGLDRMRVAWEHLRIPGPPAEYALTRIEVEHPDPQRRFARRTIQEILCDDDRLALIDKASPHSLFDLMVSEISDPPKATPCAVEPITGAVLWRTGLAFVRFVSDPQIMRRFDLADGELHLALNCDPNTHDRESVQAAKQFHLHLLYWSAEALAPLESAGRFGAAADVRLRRQAIDPLSFLGARLIHASLAGFDLGIPGARLAVPDERLTIRGDRPLGCLIELPGWQVLGDPAFEDLIRRLHLRLESLAADLLEVFTGQRRAPSPWHRHALRPHAHIARGLAGLPVSARIRAGLGELSLALRDLPVSTARRLERTDARRRMDLMTLNQPCYALNLHAPERNRQGATLEDAGVVHLTIQPKLFSGIGGAGLLGLGGVPSVRILRGEGRLSVESWHRRGGFQRAFAEFNRSLQGDNRVIRFQPLKRFIDPSIGWA